MANWSRPWNYGHSDPRLAATAVATNMDIAWAAGIYEGEGTVFKGLVSVIQKDEWMPLRLKELFGGSVIPIRIKRATVDELRTYYRWNANGARGRGFLMTIYSFLSPRRKAQARKALESVGG